MNIESKPEVLQSAYILGVTGGIGAGKTAATDIFQELGIVVVDADVVSRKIVEKGSIVLRKIQEHFGQDILLTNGELNRAKLREIIFEDQESKNWLNSVMHPAIRQQLFTELTQANSDYVILSAPLLFDNGLNNYCDSVMVIDVPEEVQLHRASGRDSVTAEQIQSIISSQMSRNERLDKADVVIDNSGQLAQLNNKIVDFHRQLVKRICR